MRIDVFATPRDLTQKALDESAVIVFDVLRMTSVAITALSNGCRAIVPVGDIESAKALADTYPKGQALLCGERGAKRIDGFDLSNSPLEYDKGTVFGKTLIVTTTNGTKALLCASQSPTVYLGGFVNVSAVARQVENAKSLCLICAGTDGQFALEDVLAAGVVIEKLIEAGVQPDLGDFALGCHGMYERFGENIALHLAKTDHVRRLVSYGYAADVAFCLTADRYDVVARFQEGRVVVNEG